MCVQACMQARLHPRVRRNILVIVYWLSYCYCIILVIMKYEQSKIGALRRFCEWTLDLPCRFSNTHTRTHARIHARMHTHNTQHTHTHTHTQHTHSTHSTHNTHTTHTQHMHDFLPACMKLSSGIRKHTLNTRILIRTPIISMRTRTSVHY